MKSKKLLFSAFIASVFFILTLCALFPMPEVRQTNEADIIKNGRYISEVENAD